MFKAFSSGNSKALSPDLTIESSVDHLSIIGAVDITRDLRGLELAKQLQSILREVIRVLQEDHARGPLARRAAAEAADHSQESLAMNQPPARHRPRIYLAAPARLTARCEQLNVEALVPADDLPAAMAPVPPRLHSARVFLLWAHCTREPGQRRVPLSRLWPDHAG